MLDLRFNRKLRLGPADVAAALPAACSVLLGDYDSASAGEPGARGGAPAPPPPPTTGPRAAARGPAPRVGEGVAAPGMRPFRRGLGSGGADLGGEVRAQRGVFVRLRVVWWDMCIPPQIDFRSDECMQSARLSPPEMDRDPRHTGACGVGLSWGVRFSGMQQLGLSEMLLRPPRSFRLKWGSPTVAGLHQGYHFHLDG